MPVPGSKSRLLINLDAVFADFGLQSSRGSLICCLSVFLSLAILPSLLTAGTAQDPGEQSQAGNGEYFSQKVAPLLQKHCQDCHGPDAQEGQLRLDSLQAMNSGGKSGPPIVPGKADESLLMAAVRYRDEALRMPPEKKLTDEEIGILNDWISSGAVHPEGAVVFSEPAPPFDVQQAREFWSFKSPVQPAVPQDAPSEYVSGPIDAFVVSAMQNQGLKPNDVADRQTLIRRATFDLLGLPPTIEEIDAFLADSSPTAYATVIDRLLRSPHYGERWGRHWLDVVRYADSNGLDENVAHGNAWRFRDYIVESINADKPYDQFLREQIAGDLLITEDTDEMSRRTLLTATGFLSLGPKVLAEPDKTKMLMDILDEQIDTTGRAFLGMTFGCARCHNHKFDPVSQADYYALAGIFKSTYTMESLVTIAKWNENPVATNAETESLKAHQGKIDHQKSQIASLVETTKASLVNGANSTEEQFPDEVKKQLADLRAEQKKLEESTPELPTAMGVKEGTPEAVRINIRGSHLTLGRPVTRGVPVVLQLGQPLAIEEKQSGRLQLANWLTDARNPLTARVFVNRVWRWHFGRGLVASTDNFGHLGERPSHPELLDWLTAEFIQTGWSMKSLHRMIMLSRTYQLSSDSSQQAAQSDPANIMLWRGNLHRLEAEAIRDSILAVSGLLDRSMGGSMLHVKNREFLFNHTSKDETRYDSLRRSLYLPVIRNNIYDGFSLFDCTDGAVPNGNRSTSTVASQALFLMNSDLILQASSALADGLLKSGPENASERIQLLFRRVLGRPATQEETDAMLKAADQVRDQLISEQVPETELVARTWSVLCQGVLASNEFIYVR